MDSTKSGDHQADISANQDTLYRKAARQYYAYALQWWAYPRWTVEETANLLNGCVPIRPLLLRGDDHRQTDDEVVELENRLRADIGARLTRISNRRYFDKTYVASAEVLPWAQEQDIAIPADLLRAEKEYKRDREHHGYRTPAMAALDWVVERFWQGADLRDPPGRGEIIQALLQNYPSLTPEECEMIEAIARHPAAIDP